MSESISASSESGSLSDDKSEESKEQITQPPVLNDGEKEKELQQSKNEVESEASIALFYNAKKKTSNVANNPVPQLKLTREILKDLGNSSKTEGAP